MIKNRYRRGIAIILGLSFLITGCGRSKETKVPELVESVSVNFSYRPAEYGYINPPKLGFATVTAKEKCYYFPTNVTVTKIVVEPGDTVKKGDVLAYADATEANKQLAELKKQLAYENSLYKLNQSLVKVEIEGYKEAGDKTSINVQKENSRYDKKLWQYKTQKISDEIQKYNELVKDGTLYATEDGQVVYTKNLANGNTVGTNDNVVVTVNNSEKYLCLDVKYSQYMDYEKKYTFLAGKQININEIEYSTEEQVLAKANDATVDDRLTCDGIEKLDVGTTLPIYFLRDDEEKSLLIGADSLYTENGSNFVYVRDENNQRKRVEVTIGRQNSNYCEVTDGLEEGDSVYYESSTVMPSDYQTCKVERSACQVPNYSRTYELSGDTAISCTSNYQGKLGDLISGTEFKKGDLLYSVDTGEGAAALLAASNAIKQENSAYNKSCKDYKKQKKEAKEDKRLLKKLNLEEKIAKLNHDYNLSQLQKTYNELKENNNGKGRYNVYAAFDGKVKELKFKDGQMVEVGDEVLSVATGEKKFVVVEMNPYNDDNEKSGNVTTNIADIGEKITVTADKKEYKGICVGVIGDGKAYVQTDDNGAHVSKNVDDGYAQKAFLVKMDKDFYKDMPDDCLIKFTYLDIPEVLLIPREAVCTEQDVTTAQNRMYVWRKVDGELEKQFVTVSDEDCFSSTKYVPVISGLSEGDEIIVSTGNK